MKLLSDPCFAKARRLSFANPARALLLNALDLRTHWRGSLALMKHLEQEPRDELASFQLKDLRRLIGFAARNVPFYSRKLRNVGLNSHEKTSDLSKLPLTQKEELRANFGETIAIGLKRRGILNHTSGSTGRPFAFYEDKASLGMTIASRFLFDSWAGVSAGQPRVRLVTRVHRLWPRLFFNEKQIPLSLVTPSKGTEVFNAISKHKPSVLDCPPSAANILSEHPVRELGLRSLITSAEDLTESLRRKLESRWGVVVQNRYGLREVSGYVAQECVQREGLHINAARAIVEVVRDGEAVSPGEEGEIVITDLCNYVMPFIRYATGDIAEQGDTCTCGNTFPLIQKIVGRSVEYLRAKNGDLIRLSFFADEFGALFFDEVIQFQLIDRGIGKIGVRVIPSHNFSQTTYARMEQWLKLIADEVEIETVKSIPLKKRRLSES